MSDKWLARIVALGIVILTAGALSSATALMLNDKDANAVFGIAGALVGALAGFFAGSKFSSEG